MTLLRSRPKGRRIKALIFAPLALPAAYARAQWRYAWLRRGDNRYRWVAHGHSGSLLFDLLDERAASVPFQRFAEAFGRDAAAHTKRRYKK